MNASNRLNETDIAGIETRRTSSLLRCLLIVARHKGLHLSESQLMQQLGLAAGEPSMAALMRIARRAGLRGVAVEMRFRDLLRLNQALPAIVLMKNGSTMVLRSVEGTSGTPRVTIQDPNAGDSVLLTFDETRFCEGWSGEIILLKRVYYVEGEEKPFGLASIVAKLYGDRRLVFDLLVSAFLLSLLALSPIMFWRILIDQVLYLGSINTFTVLCIAMLMCIVFEMAFGYARRYIVLYMIRKFDVDVPTLIFNRLLNLPLDYFESKNTGEISRDINELWKLRRFIVSELLGTVLDGVVIVIVIPILFFFSVLLTVLVLLLASLMCVWLLIMLPVHQKRAAAVFHAEGVKHSLLIETLHGMRTVKSLALDERIRQDWDRIVARLADLRFQEGRVANVIQTVAMPIERFMTTGVIALAVYLAIATKDQYQIGSLVAFMMLTMRLAGPLSRLAGVLPEYDEAQTAVRVISKMINQPPEEGRGRSGLRAPIVGRIEFRDVRFRYPGATTHALDGVTMTIPEGTVFGVMGRSGSGKTTVTRLLQSLHSNYEGLIRIDGNDLRAIDVDHLRSSIGVVLQENFLFRGTVRQTISAAKADATYDEVVEAARLAGADEFVERLPGGYETWIQEGSTNLSGGQRQRLAIARALITKPRILILDEATSALDAESEAIVNANLLRIAQGRTLLIISHRLSSLVMADSILVLERGRVDDIGTHEELMSRCEIYGWLWHQQHRHLQPPALQ